MDKAIHKHIKGLKQIAEALYKDRDIDGFKYSEIKMVIDKLEGHLLAYDELYDQKKKNRARP